MSTHVHTHNHYHGVGEEVLKSIFSLLNTINTDMGANTDQVNAALATLNQHITDAEARITAKETAEAATIVALQAQIAAGGATADQLQTILDGITAADTSVQTIDPPAAAAAAPSA